MIQIRRNFRWEERRRWEEGGEARRGGSLTLALVRAGVVGDEVRLPDDGVQPRALHPPQPAHGLRAHQAAEGPR